MSKEELLAAILELPTDEQRTLVEQVVEQLPPVSDPDMTPELLAELNRRHEEILANPDDGIPLDQFLATLQRRAVPPAAKKNVGA